MGVTPRVGVSAVVLMCGLGAARAGTVAGKLELPAPPERPPVEHKGFLDRMENPVTPARAVSVAPLLLVVLEGAAPATGAPPPVTWSLVGDSFARPVVGAMAGAEVVIKNDSRTARALAFAEDPKLLASGPLNPTGSKSFKAPAPGTLTAGDPGAPHLHGTIVVTASPYIANVDDGNRFELADVPAGDYKVRVFYRSAWLDVAQPVTVPAKGKAEVTVKIAALPVEKAGK